MESDEVAIIGAGLAGLTAGYYLKEQGIPFQIFEARDRAGGRALTEYFTNDSFEELGGKEISDGGEALCINQLANKLDCKITTLETDYDVVALISNIRQSLFEYDGLPNNKILENPGAYASLSDRLNMFIGKNTEIRKLIEKSLILVLRSMTPKQKVGVASLYGLLKILNLKFKNEA